MTKAQRMKEKNCGILTLHNKLVETTRKNPMDARHRVHSDRDEERLWKLSGGADSSKERFYELKESAWLASTCLASTRC